MINIPPIFKKIFNNNLGIILAYIFLALFFTFPLILNITDSMATGKNRIDNDYTINSDSIYFIWNFWSFKHNLVDLGVSPFSHSDFVFYPNGFDVSAGGYDNVLNSLLSLPLQLITNNLILVYNILALFNFVFAAYSAYLLANYLIGDKKISFLSGIIFGFSPYMIARSLGHFNLLTAGAIPLVALFCLKMLDEPKIKNSLLLAVAFFMTTISSWQYGLFAGIFVFFSSAYFAYHQKEKILNKTYLKNFIIFSAASLILLLPVAFPMIKSTLEKKSTPSNFMETLIYSADPFSFLTPIPLSNFGGFTDPSIYITFSGNTVESTTYLGILELIVIFFSFHYRKKLDKRSKYWLYLLIVFFILSLGPYLKVFMLIVNEIPLPYYFILKYIPFFNFAKESVRLSIFIALFSSIIFAFALKYLFSLKNYSPRKNEFLAFLAAVIILERTIFPYPIEKISSPSFYHKISQEKENYAILDLPVDSILGFSFYNYFQTIHGKNITSGKIMPYTFTSDVYAFIKNDAFLSRSTCVYDKKIEEDPYTAQNNSVELEKFRKNNIKYVVIHKDLIGYFDKTEKTGGREYSCRPLKNAIELFFGSSRPVYEDELIRVYDISK